MNYGVTPEDILTAWWMVVLMYVRTLYMHMLLAHAHVACPCPCCMPMPMLHAHAACPCPCCMPMLHAHARCPCPCCMPMSVNIEIEIDRKRSLRLHEKVFYRKTVLEIEKDRKHVSLWEWESLSLRESEINALDIGLSYWDILRLRALDIDNLWER